MKKVKIHMHTPSYFYSKDEEYLVKEGTAISWEVAEGEYKGRLIAHGHCKVITDSKK